MVACSLVETRNQVGAAWPRRSGAHREATGELGLVGRGQGSTLLVPDAHPLYSALPDGIAQRVQRIPDKAENLLDSNLLRTATRASATVRDMQHLHDWPVLSQWPPDSRPIPRRPCLSLMLLP